MKKTELQREQKEVVGLFEFTEMKIAGKRRMEPEWSSQNGAGLILVLGHHFHRWSLLMELHDAVTIFSLIYIVR